MKQTHKHFPTFLGIGAQKAGTTWLHYQLNQHPEVWLTPHKEIHFFDRSTKYPSPNDLSTQSLFQRMIGTEAWQRPRTIKGLRTVAKKVKQNQITEALWWSKFILGNYNEDWYCDLFAQARSFKVKGEITPSYSMIDNEDIATIKRINPDMKFIFLIRDPIERDWSGIRFLEKLGKLNSESNEEIIDELR